MLIIDPTAAAAIAAARHPPAPPPRQRINALRGEWRRVARRLADPDVELDADTFAGVLAVHARLRAAGVAIDPMADALIRQCAQQLDDAHLAA
ncbi:MAG TPA: hypothetical protein VF624_18845 [Tepidisphaeraceae bacterium]|jgi:hypothetical protein